MCPGSAMTTASALTAREVYQVLKDIAMGVITMRRLSALSWSEIYAGHMPVEVDGWTLTLFNDCGSLDYCEYCRSVAADRKLTQVFNCFCSLFEQENTG